MDSDKKQDGEDRDLEEDAAKTDESATDAPGDSAPDAASDGETPQDADDIAEADILDEMRAEAAREEPADDVGEDGALDTGPDIDPGSRSVDEDGWQDDVAAGPAGGEFDRPADQMQDEVSPAAGAAVGGAAAVAGASTVDAQPDSAPDPAQPAAVAPPPPAAPQVVERRSGGFMPALFGGILAAGAGFAVAEYDVAGMLGMSGRPDPVARSINAQAERLAALETQIAGIAEAVQSPGADDGAISRISEMLDARLSEVTGGVASVGDRVETLAGDLDAAIDEVGAQIAAVDDRLTAVEERPLQESSETARAAFAAYESQIEELQSSLDAQQEENRKLAEELQASVAAAREEAEAAATRAAELQREAEARAEEAAARAAAEAQAAARAEALASLDAALERGIGFGPILDKLAAYADIPPALSENSDGVASMSDLRAAFVPAAREALDAALKATVDDDPAARLEAFLRTQVGYRSLAPKEGDDPDAVLSRAEADLEAGDLAATLAEIETLPEAGRAEMADWAATARTRLDATQAAASLSETILAQ